MKKRKQNDLLVFLGGLAMLVAGLYWFMTKVTVSTANFFGGSLTLGNFQINSGLIVVPFIATIIWLFVNPDSFLAKIGVGLSVILIIAAVIMNTTIRLRPTSLYEYLLMLVFIFGGGGMVLRVLCNPKYSDKKDKKDKKEDDE